MNNKEEKKAKAIQPKIEPALKLVDDGGRILLAVKPLGITPFVYALVLRGNGAGGYIMRPDTEQYSFNTLGERARYLSALTQLMRYQHTDSATKRIVDLYKTEIQDFANRIHQLDNER